MVLPDSSWALVFALVTALANAVALAVQHSANSRAPRKLDGWRLWRHLVAQPLWWIGWLVLGVSLAAQALALHAGPLSEVQPVLVCELLFALLLRRGNDRRRLTHDVLGATALAAGGLIAFLLSAAPQPGLTGPDTNQWIWSITGVVITVVALTGVARRASERGRTSAYGAATGLLWAIEATFIKSATDVLAHDGIVALFEHWPLYAVVVAGVAGLIYEQRALHSGPLRYSQPLIVVVDPLASVLLGLGLFHERIALGLIPDTVAVAGLFAMSFGLVRLTRTNDAVVITTTT